MQDDLHGGTSWIERPSLSEMQHKTFPGEDLEHRRNNPEEH